MYGDGLFVIGPQEVLDVTGEGINPALTYEINADDAAQDIWRWRAIFPTSIEAFGIVVTEIDAAPTTAPVLSLDVIAAVVALTRTEKLTMTLDAPLYSKGDGTKASETQLIDTGFSIGTVVMYTGTLLPFQLKAGETLVAEHKTAGDGATLAYHVFALARIDGYDLTATNVATLNAARS